jgi:hypothetical protein
VRPAPDERQDPPVKRKPYLSDADRKTNISEDQHGMTLADVFAPGIEDVSEALVHDVTPPSFRPTQCPQLDLVTDETAPIEYQMGSSCKCKLCPPPSRRKYRGFHHQASSVRKGQRQRYWHILTRIALVLQLSPVFLGCQRSSFSKPFKLAAAQQMLGLLGMLLGAPRTKASCPVESWRSACAYVCG